MRMPGLGPPRLLHQRVPESVVISVHALHIAHRLPVGDAFDVAGPDVGVEAPRLRHAAVLGDGVAAGVIARQGEEAAVFVAEVRVAEILRHQGIHIFRRRMDIGVGGPRVGDAHIPRGRGHDLHHPQIAGAAAGARVQL